MGGAVNASVTEPDSVSTAVALGAAVLGLAVAVISNLVLASRGRRHAAMSEMVDDLERANEKARRDLGESLSQESFGRVLAGLIDVVQPSDRRILDAYYGMSLSRYTQAGLTALNGRDPDGVQSEELLRADRQIRATRPWDLSPLIAAVDAARSNLVETANDTLQELRAQSRRLKEYEDRSMRISHLGTSLLILSLVFVAIKDLL